jgi:hypothetical protein
MNRPHDFAADSHDDAVITIAGIFVYAVGMDLLGLTQAEGSQPESFKNGSPCRRGPASYGAPVEFTVMRLAVWMPVTCCIMFPSGS